MSAVVAQRPCYPLAQSPADASARLRQAAAQDEDQRRLPAVLLPAARPDWGFLGVGRRYYPGK